MLVMKAKINATAGSAAPLYRGTGFFGFFTGCNA